MGTTESLPTNTEGDGDGDGDGDNEEPPNAPPRPVAASSARRGNPSSSLSSLPPPPTTVGSGSLPAPGRGTPTSQPPSRGKTSSSIPRSPVSSCRLSGLVLGRKGSGKSTLLQRLQGRDPFIVGDRQQPQDDRSQHSKGGDEDAGAVVVVPYQTTHPVLHDRITLAVRTAVDAVNDDNATREGGGGGGGGAVDFAVLLLHPTTDPRDAETYVKQCVQQFLRLQGYLPNDSDDESPTTTDGGGETSSATASAPDPSSLPPQPRPICLCLLLNFRDLKPPKHNGKSTTKKKNPPPSAGRAESTSSAAPWLSRSTVQQWVLEVLQLFDQRLDPSQLVLQIGSTSLYNCYGLNTLHAFVYHSYLARQQHDAMRRLTLVQSLLRNVPPPHDNAESSYEAFLESSKGRDRPKGAGEPPSSSRSSSRRQPPVATSSDGLGEHPQQSQWVGDPSKAPHGPRRPVIRPENNRSSKSSSTPEKEAATAPTTSPKPEPATSRVDPVEASRAALEAFLMEDDSEEDDRGGSLNRKRNSRGGDGEDDEDDDDFFVEEVPVSDVSTKMSPQVNATPPGTDRRGEQTEEGSSDANRGRATEQVGESHVGGNETEACQLSDASRVSPSVLSAVTDVEVAMPAAATPSPSRADASANATAGGTDEATKAKQDEKKRSPHTTSGPDQDNAAEAVEARLPRISSPTLDNNATNGSTGASAKRYEGYVTEKLHALPADSDSDDYAFVIQDTTPQYSPSKRTGDRARPSSQQADVPSSTLSAAALAAIAEAQRDAERMLSRPYSPLEGEARKPKAKKEKKQKKEKKGNRKDDLHG